MSVEIRVVDDPPAAAGELIAAAAREGGALALSGGRTAGAAYRAAVLSAFGDVENALGSLSHLAAQQHALEEQVTQAEGVLRAAQRKYTAGGADFLVVTDAQRSLYAARDQLADIRRAHLAASVVLFKALGGGWQKDAN